MNRTEGGEVLSECARAHVLWTRSNVEQRGCDELTAKGLEVFLPKIGAWSRLEGHRSLSNVPMFPGYLFLHHLIDKASHTAVDCTLVAAV
jgi:transcription termination/antitermination protein NusG